MCSSPSALLAGSGQAWTRIVQNPHPGNSDPAFLQNLSPSSQLSPFGHDSTFSASTAPIRLSKNVRLSQSTSLSVLFPARGIIGLLDCARGSVWGAWTALSVVTTWPSHTDRSTYWTVTLHPKPGLSSFQPRLADDRRARVRTRRHANIFAWS